jgi:alanyl-tRNA synthetase
VTGDELRQAFLSFFQDRGHKIIPSSSLLPRNDPTLLLTSAGMVQIKPYFLGLETPPSQRLASCQKCFRTTDIDSVGDSKHLTFFEMLGNFSVGDYFKKEAIFWAWEFVTEYLKLPEERLWITIYLDDDEAFAYWREVGVPAEKILRFGDEDNFWGPVGDAGPCGPCSEIHYDLGKDFGCGKAECKPNCDCGRFSEIWNLVFTQYNQDQNGQRTPLPKPNIDTGMGLERTLAAIQGKSSPYETDLFFPLVDKIRHLSGKEYGRDEDIDRAIRIVAEHSRGIAFLITDGVMPSNEGRGYVLRRILRRASLFGRKLGLKKPFLGDIAEEVINEMQDIYPELKRNDVQVLGVIDEEEKGFHDALDFGLTLWDGISESMKNKGEKTISGQVAFHLYDTYGLPREVLAEVAEQSGFEVDWEGFEEELEQQRERARVARKFKLGEITEAPAYTRGGLLEDIRFVGYDNHKLKHRSEILRLAVKGGRKTRLFEGDEGEVILRETPFYGEMGGQVGDTGVILGTEGRFIVEDTFRFWPELTIHRGKVVEGYISLKDKVEAKVDEKRRLDIARNHTATHLLQAALRQIVDRRIEQKGSLVEPERFRFDFSHSGQVTEEQLNEVQRQVNEWIRQNLKTEEKKDIPYKQAIAEGAIALFEEKYGERVRMLEIGEPAISKELCGGTHVSSTGEIGIFLITSESSIGTGLHRIEAVTGRKAESLIESRLTALQSVAKEVAGSLDEVPNKVKTLVSELETESKRVLSLERELSRRIAEDLPGQAEEVSGVTVLAAKVPPLTMPILREMGDILRDRLKSAIVVLATVYNGKPNFLAMVTPDLIAKGFHAGDIINQVAKVTGGGGGGKAAMAQAGGKDAAKIDEALKLVHKLIQKV